MPADKVDCLLANKVDYLLIHLFLILESKNWMSALCLISNSINNILMANISAKLTTDIITELAADAIAF